MFVDKCEDLDLLAQRLVPALLDPILGDYARSVPDAR
jgi:exportin-1